MHLSQFFQGRAGTTNLVGVNKGMIRVNRQPVGGGITSTLRMRARALPIRVSEVRKKSGGRATRPFKRVQARFYRAVVMQAAGKFRLIVPLDYRVILDKQTPQPDRGSHLAIREVMHDLSWRPLTRRFARIPLRVGHAFERRDYGIVSGLILCNQFPSLLRVHSAPRSPYTNTKQNTTDTQGDMVIIQSPSQTRQKSVMD